MARQQTRELTRRAQVDSRVSFDYTTPNLEVVARTTDPFVNQSHEGSGWRRLANALGIAQNALPTIEMAAQYKAGEDLKQGQLDALLGKDKPTKGMYRIKGWETITGDITARTEYRQEVEQFFHDNYKFMTAEEFEQGLQEISRKYLEGSSPFFLEGFVTRANEIEQKAFQDYVDAQRELTDIDFRNKAATLAADEGVLATEQVLSSTFGLETLDELLSSPWAYVALDTGAFDHLFAAPLREALSNAQQMGQDYGLSKTEISSIFVDEIGRLAKKYGIPQLMAFAYEKDEDGVALVSSTIGKGIPQAEQTAKSKQTSIAKDYKKELEDQKKAEEARLAKEETERLDNLNKTLGIQVKVIEESVNENADEAVEVANDLLGELLTNPDFWKLNEKDFTNKTDRLISIISKDTRFRTETDPDTYDRLFSKETITKEEIDEAFKAGLLSRQDWITLINRFREQEKNAHKDPEFAEETEGATYAKLFGKKELTWEEIEEAREKKLLSRQDWRTLIDRYYAQEERKTQEAAKAEADAKKAEEAADKAALQEKIDDLKFEMSHQVTTVLKGTPEQAFQLYFTLRSNPLLKELAKKDGVWVEQRLRELYDKSMEDTFFAEKTPGPTFKRLKDMMEDGTLDLIDLERTLKAGDLSRDDWEMFREAYTKQELKKADEAAKADEERQRELQDALEKNNRELVKDFLKDMSVKISDITTLKDTKDIVPAATALREEFLSSPVLDLIDPQNFEKYLKEITDLTLKDMDFPEEVPEATFINLYNKAQSDSLDWQEVETALANRQLTATQTKTLIDAYSVQQRRLASQERELRDSVAKKALEYEKEARARWQKMLDDSERERIRLANEAREAAVKEIYDGLFEISKITDPRERAFMAEDLYDLLQERDLEHDFSPETFSLISNRLSSYIEKKDSLPAYGDDMLYAELSMKAVVFGELEPEEILAAASANLITEAQLNSLTTKWKQQDDEKKREQEEWPDKEAFRTIINDAKRAIVDADPITGILGDKSLQWATVSREIEVAILRFREEHGHPGLEDLRTILEPIIIKHQSTWDEIFANYGSPRDSLYEIKTDGRTQWKTFSEINPEELYQTQEKVLGIFPKTVTNPSWKLKVPEAFDYYKEKIGEGLNKKEVQAQLEAEIGEMDPEASRFYAEVFADTVATRWFLLYGFTDEEMMLVKQYLNSVGYDDREISDVIGRARENIQQYNE